MVEKKIRMSCNQIWKPLMALCTPSKPTSSSRRLKINYLLLRLTTKIRGKTWHASSNYFQSINFHVYPVIYDDSNWSKHQIPVNIILDFASFTFNPMTFDRQFFPEENVSEMAPFHGLLFDEWNVNSNNL